MDWITTVNGLIALLSGLFGLIGTGVATFFAIKGWIKATKEKTAKERWDMIMAMADAAMKEFEHSTLAGVEKKQAVINSVKASAKAAGLNIDPFVDQLGAYIDSCIEWYNGMNNKKD